MSFLSRISFLFFQIAYKCHYVGRVSGGKEVECNYTVISISWTREKASVSAFPSGTCSGSVTVEAVICFPLFLYAAICLIWMLELRAIQIRVRCALQDAGKQMAVELAEIPILIPAELEAEIINIIGKERITRSLIDGEIKCSKSYIWPGTGVMELQAEYKVKLPVPFFMIPPLKYEESMRIKAWNGYVNSEFGNGITIEKTVYVTETGVVYHEDYHCNYLEPSIRSVSSEALESLRNTGGGKYYPCLVCGYVGREQYYVTDYGNKYHSSLSCIGLKRKIYAVPISEIKGKGACSKCGQ